MLPGTMFMMPGAFRTQYVIPSHCGLHTTNVTDDQPPPPPPHTHPSLHATPTL
jgi:hypothetical protein